MTTEMNVNGGETQPPEIPTKISLHMEDLLSPLAKPSNNNGTAISSSSSPTEQTVAETPSPNGMSMLSPAELQVKRLVELESAPRSPAMKRVVTTTIRGSPIVTDGGGGAKPFDESPSAKLPQPFDEDFDALWEEESDGHKIINNDRRTQERKDQLNYVLSRMMQHDEDVIKSPETSMESSTRPVLPPSTTSSLAKIASTLQPTLQPLADDKKLQKLQELSALISETAEESVYDVKSKTNVMETKEDDGSFAVQLASPRISGGADPPFSPPLADISMRSNRTFGPESPGTPPAELPSLSMQASTRPNQLVGMTSTPGTSPIRPATPSVLMHDDSVYLKTPPASPQESSMILDFDHNVATIQHHIVKTPPGDSHSSSKNDDDNHEEHTLKPKNLKFSAIKAVAHKILDDSEDDLVIVEEMAGDEKDLTGASLLADTPADEPGKLEPPKWEEQDLGSVGSSNGDEIPFDCVNDYSDLLDRNDTDLERGFASFAPLPPKASSRRQISFGGMFRKMHHPWAKEIDGANNVVPDEVINNILASRQQSASPAELIQTRHRQKGEIFEDEPLGSMTLAGASSVISGVNMSFDTVDRPGFSIRGSGDRPSPKKKRRYFVRKTHKEEPEEAPRGRNWLLSSLYAITLLILVTCGVMAILFVSGVMSFWQKDAPISLESQNKTIDDVATVATVVPSLTNLYDGDKLLACSNAEALVEMDRPYYGSNWKALVDESVNGCGDQLSVGHAVWYAFTTPYSRLVEASTCNNADFDTKITVMAGSCTELSCVTFNDEYCGHQSKVRWYAQRGTTYYIMVHGHRESSGTFGLTMKESHPHDDCFEASSANPGSVVVGTTAGSHSTAPPTCGDVDASVPGVWYTMESVSGYQRAEILQGHNEFTGQVAVYRSMDEEDVGCDALICDKGSANGSVVWLAESKRKYYLFVSGQNETSGGNGEFELFLGHDYAHSCELSTKVDANAIGFLASTHLASPQNIKSCGYTGYHTAPGVWFSVEGTGEVLVASTCGSVSDLETEISVFGGTCDGLQCLGGTGQDLPCGPNGEIAWETTAGDVYHIYVSGRSNRQGDFVLNVQERLRYDGYSCNASLPLDLGSTTLKSATTYAPSEAVNVCPGFESARGVWHSFIGTGKAIKLSACHSETEFDAIISVFTGECGGLSCVSHTTTTCGPNDDILITTHVGVVYHVFVHGPNSFAVGSYRLTIDEAPINDSCLSAQKIDMVDANYHGNTLSANISTALECAGGPMESNGLFYKFTGNGETISFSTCGNQTTYDTQITVYAGSCSQLTCVANDDDVCGKQSSVSFPSVANETYYVRVGGGNSTENVGSFDLDVTIGSPFFNA